MRKGLKTALIISAVLMAFTIFVIIGFITVQKSNSTPIDLAVKDYFYFDDDFKAEYGQVYSVGRNRSEDIIEEELVVTAHYNISTEKADFIVRVKLDKRDETFVVIGYDIVERKNGY